MLLRAFLFFFFMSGIVWPGEEIPSSEHFDILVEYAPKQARPGYVFKISLVPHSDVTFKKIRQNFYFLIDRSNSISKSRFSLNKHAVFNALNFLNPGDCFNILLFDGHVTQFSPNAVVCSPETLVSAREFLEKQGHGGFFAGAPLYASLKKMIPTALSENEMNAAILLSDGDQYLSQENQRLTIGRFSSENKGKVSLYALASGPKNNLPLLDLLSTFNKGFLLHVQDHRAIGERLNFLMRTLQHPIGNQITASANSDDKSMLIMLQPKAARIPNLYQNRPFVLYGTTNKLSDFELVLQGKCADLAFEIRKKVTFKEAKLDTYFVERNWTQLLVQEFYERYFEEGSLAHLQAAKQLLIPLNLPTPLID